MFLGCQKIISSLRHLWLAKVHRNVVFAVFLDRPPPPKFVRRVLLMTRVLMLWYSVSNTDCFCKPLLPPQDLNTKLLLFENCEKSHLH